MNEKVDSNKCKPSESKIEKSYTLPSDFKLLESFIKKNKVELMEHTLTAIERSIENKFQVIELFHFENTDYVITLSQKEFLENIENIFQFYLQTEQYELCTRLKKIESLLKIENEKVKK